MKENENEDDLDYELDDASINSDNKNNIFLPEMKMVKDEDIEPKVPLSNQKNQIHSPDIFSLLLDSPRTGPNHSSTNPDTNSKTEPKYLHLQTTHLRVSTISDHLSLHMSKDHILNSDNEVMLCQIRSI